MTNKPDLAHRRTDKKLAELEQRIAEEHKKAADELTDRINAYFESFKKRDEETKKLIGTIVNGREYTEQDYKQWRLAQIGRGKRFEGLRDRIAERMTHANEVAAAYINDKTAGIYSLNRNYAAYTIEQVAGDVGFDLWDEQTVKRLIVEQPDLMPYYPPKRAVKRGIDLAWGKRQITAQVTAGILQGESIKHLADRLQNNIPNMNRDSAIRAARTAVTGAQNAGRQDSYDAAVKMGIEMEKQWLATLDGRTRHDHAVADGQTVAEDKPFSVGGHALMYPGDPSGPGHEIYNCRCTMIAKVKGVDMSDAKRRARDPETGESVLIENMTYAEWAGWKERTAKTEEKPFDWLDGVRTPGDIVTVMENRGWFKQSQRYSASLDGADFDGAMAVYRGYEKFFDKYPQMVGKFLPVVCEDLSRGKAYAQASTMGGGISVNRKFFSDGKKLAEEYLKDVALHFHPAGTDWQSLVTHECGHGLDGFLTATLKSKNPVSADMQKSVLKACGVKKSQIGDEVSIYASQNNFEFFSECLAEGLWSENPRKVATEFMKQLDKIMKGIS